MYLPIKSYHFKEKVLKIIKMGDIVTWQLPGLWHINFLLYLANQFYYIGVNLQLISVKICGPCGYFLNQEYLYVIWFPIRKSECNKVDSSKMYTFSTKM